MTIDLDPTDDPTHGAQQLTFFNGHYDCWCSAAARLPDLRRRIRAVRLRCDGRGPDLECHQRADRACPYRDALCGQDVGPRAPRRHQGRSGPPAGPRAARQPAFRHHESPAGAALRLRARLLRPWRHRKWIKELHDGLQIGRTAVVASGPINCVSSSPPPPMS